MDESKNSVFCSAEYSQKLKRQRDELGELLGIAVDEMYKNTSCDPLSYLEKYGDRCIQILHEIKDGEPR